MNSNSLRSVEIAGTGVYLPGEAIPFEKIEEIIGCLDKASPRTQKMINKLRPVVKDLIGIQQCHFAVCPETKELTESNTSMAKKAILNALTKAKVAVSEIDCIVLATPLSDYQTPPTSTLIQGDLGIERCAEMEVHSNCTGITKALQIAFDAIRVGRYRTVAVVYSQLSSAYLLADHYNQAKIKTENLLLRWFLSDSASAVVMREKKHNNEGLEVIDIFNESLGGKREPAMWFYHGAKNFSLLKSYEQGLHHLGQDYNTVINDGEQYFVEAMRSMVGKTDIAYDKIDHVLASIPSAKLIEKGKKAFKNNFNISEQKWFSNVDTKGYSGGSSVIIGLDEMLENNIFKPGQILACVTIESSKWMVGGFMLKFNKK